MRVVAGLSYCGSRYLGWQRQPSGQTVQDHVERALSCVAGQPIRVHCAGRTDAGVHAAMQVLHFDSPIVRRMQSWVRGTNADLPHDIALHWAQEVPSQFHSRRAATSRRYAYFVRQSTIRPSIETGRVGWSYRALDGERMQQAAQILVGEHDFSAFRAAECQALSPVKNLIRLNMRQRRAETAVYWRFDFEANAFLHHMIRNMMGCLLMVGDGRREVSWLADVLAKKSRKLAAPTFPSDGLYFLGPTYDPSWGLPTQSPFGLDWMFDGNALT